MQSKGSKAFIRYGDSIYILSLLWYSTFHNDHPPGVTSKINTVDRQTCRELNPTKYGNIEIWRPCHELHVRHRFHSASLINRTKLAHWTPWMYPNRKSRRFDASLFSVNRYDNFHNDTLPRGSKHKSLLSMIFEDQPIKSVEGGFYYTR